VQYEYPTKRWRKHSLYESHKLGAVINLQLLVPNLCLAMESIEMNLMVGRTGLESSFCLDNKTLGLGVVAPFYVVPAGTLIGHPDDFVVQP